MNHNNKNTESEGFTMTINEFADLSAAEFKMRMGFKKPNRFDSLVNKDSFETINPNAPESLDWRDQNAVNPIKN
jgi:hypothetical protein